jgi:hypothetical protein
MTLAEAIAVRDVLKTKHSIYRDLAQAATVTQDRFSKSEVKFKSTVVVSELQKTADQYAKDHRDLDAQIQAANWQAELLE